MFIYLLCSTNLGTDQFAKFMAGILNPIASANSSEIDRMFDDGFSGSQNRAKSSFENVILNSNDINNPFEDGSTHLMRAANQGNLSFCKRLVEKNARTDLTDENGNTVLHYAAMKIPKNFPLVMQPKDDNSAITMCKFLLDEAKVDINAVNDDGRTALFNAIEADYTQLALYLINQKINIFARSKKSNMSALMLAIGDKNFDICEQLLKKGVDPKEIYDNDMTPLHFAAGMGSVKLCKLLVEEGADVKAEDNKGMNPFRLALGRLNNVKDEYRPNFIEVIAYLRDLTL